MYFGGIEGMNSFYPSEIVDNDFIPPIVITSFKLFNKEVGINEERHGNTVLKS